MNHKKIFEDIIKVILFIFWGFYYFFGPVIVIFYISSTYGYNLGLLSLISAAVYYYVEGKNNEPSKNSKDDIENKVKEKLFGK